MRSTPMIRFPLSIVAATITAILSPTLQAADTSTAQQAAIQNVERIEVVGEKRHGYSDPSMNSSTGMALSVMDTPQSVSSISLQMMDDFSLNNLNDALMYSGGIHVEKIESDRTYYTARGFNVNNFQIDGVGLPLVSGNIWGDLDTSIYQRVDIVMGANGLMAGAGNPAATVNLIRKRPTADFRASIDASAGSWDTHRLSTDVSGSLNDSGSVRGRVVATYQHGDSYLDFYSKTTKIGYGVIEADLNDSTTLTAGLTWQGSYTNHPMWGALPMHYADGTATDYSRSTNTAADWSSWDNRNRNSFIELTHQFANGWEAKATYSYTNRDTDSELFYMFGSPASPENEAEGLVGYASIYTGKVKQHLFNLTVNGNYSLFGRQHELVLGGSWAKSDFKDMSIYDENTVTGNYTPTGDLTQWDGNYQRSPWAYDLAEGSDYTDREESLFAATRFSATDSLSLIAGARVVNWKTKGDSYDEVQDRSDNGHFIPYIGAVYYLTDDLMAYASYTETFTPQTETDINHHRLDSSDGVNQEIGLKQSLFDGQAVASLALFKTEYNNLAEAGGYIPGTSEQYFTQQDFESKGVEVQFNGEVYEGLQTIFSYTYTDIDDNHGDRTRPYTPKQTAKFTTSYRLPMLEQLKVGASARWQDKIWRSNTGTIPDTKQEAYTLIDLMASYQILPQLQASLNIKNVTDKKYLNSLYWAQAYYGAPRNVTLSLNYTF